LLCRRDVATHVMPCLLRLCAVDVLGNVLIGCAVLGTRRWSARTPTAGTALRQDCVGASCVVLLVCYQRQNKVKHFTLSRLGHACVLQWCGAALGAQCMVGFVSSRVLCTHPLLTNAGCLHLGVISLSLSAHMFSLRPAARVG
jgi:hypothetical protein